MARASTAVLVEDGPQLARRGGGPPTDRGGGGGGGGSGGGGGDDDRDDAGDAPHGSELADFGVRLAMVGIASLFLVFFAAYIHLRRAAPEWPPTDAPRAPLGLWISTLLLIGSSATIARAGRAQAPSRRWLTATFVLGTAFLASQITIWGYLVNAGLLPSTNGYGTVFYALTGLHGLHVCVGLGYMARLLFVRKAPMRVSALRLCALYWHFMGLVWLILFTLLWIPEGAST